MSASDVVVALRGITKRFGGITACDDVSLELRAGEIHGVLGENGAGKSTLMKVLVGVVQPDAGSIVVDGRSVRIRTPADAARAGVAMVHQHLSLVDALTVWENVVLGDGGRVDARGARDRVRELAARYDLPVDPDARVGELSIGLRQRVEILKCLRHDPRAIILDEPTAGLASDESVTLFEVVRRTAVERGCAVALVSHKLDEVLAATDEITIMRRGRVVHRQRTADATVAGLARAMVGRDVSLRGEAAALGLVDEAARGGDPGARADAAGTDAASAARAPVLAIDALTLVERRRGRVLDGLSLHVDAGEIVGVAGVEGNGQSALGDVLASLQRVDTGTVRVDGRAVPCGKAGAMSAAGIGVVPEDRHRSGVVLELSVAENLVLVEPGTVSRRGVLSRRRLAAHAEALMHEYEIVAPSPWAPLWSLSGGNQQRVVLARELSRRPKVLVAAQPTRGLDVGAIEYTNRRLCDAAAGGVAVVLISNELEEVLALSHRVAVLSRGRIVATFARAQVDLAELTRLMGGSAA